MSNMTHLDELEAEAIYIMREVAAESEKPVMLYSIGKDSSVMLHLALKAFYPEKPPFPFLHVNTTWKFHEMIEFRDQVAKKYGIEMLEYINQDGVAQGINPFDHGAAYTDIMKTQALKQALDKALQQPLAAAAETKRNPAQKSVFSPSATRATHGIRKTSALKCGSSTIQGSSREKRSAFSRSRTGQRPISGSISVRKRLTLCRFILPRSVLSCAETVISSW